MGRKFKTYDQDELYFVTFTIIQWIDLFTRKVYRDILLDSLSYCQKNKGLELYAYCIMSNHIHLIIGRNKDNTISDIIRDFKKFTSNQIIEEIQINQEESRKAWLLSHFKWAGINNRNNLKFQVWQQKSHPIELNTPSKLKRCLKYIHENPVKAGIVLSPEEYLYSSAKNYVDSVDTLIDVILID